MSAGGGEPPKREGGSSLFWVQGLICGGLLAIRPMLALLIVALFWPVGFAFALDRTPGRPLLRCVGICAVAGAISPLHQAWIDPAQLGASLDPQTLGIAWAAAAAGWLLHEVAPLAVRAVSSVATVSRAARLRIERARLAEQWTPGEPDR